jgi:hypothetical protein
MPAITDAIGNIGARYRNIGAEYKQNKEKRVNNPKEAFNNGSLIVGMRAIGKSGKKAIEIPFSPYRTSG